MINLIIGLWKELVDQQYYTADKRRVVVICFSPTSIASPPSFSPQPTLLVLFVSPPISAQPQKPRDEEDEDKGFSILSFAMISAKSDSDVTSLAPSSPSRSPKPPAYYVQSPSRDSHDGDKSSSLHTTPIYNNSPMESPSHHSFGRHSRNSSGSRFSGIFRSSSGRKGGRKHRNDKGWPECNVIMEEGTYDEVEDKALSRRIQAMIALFSFVVLFATFCLIIWGASKPYKAEITVKSLEVNNFYAGEGSDSTGVPTKMITLNGTVKMTVYNPATTFGIHVTSPSVNLMFSEIPVATGQMTKYYQPRKSHRTVNVILEGDKVPLYGAGSNFTLPSTGGKVPFELKFEVWSRGYVVGKLVTTTHKKIISCPVTVDSTVTKPILFKNNDCTYE